MKKSLLLIMALCLSFLLQAVTPTITSFTPTSGPVGTTVTISGTNFNTTPANNVVFFGATKATVSAATASSLTVTVPAGATYQNISVLDITSTLTAYSATPFSTTFTGGGAFAPKFDFTAGAGAYSISTGDLNGDGKPDLAVTNYTSNTVSVFINTSTIGTVSFAPKVDYTTGTGPASLSMGDLNGDGKPDLAITNFSSTTVSVFINNGNGIFAPKIDYATGIQPYTVSIADLNGDGKPDLAVTNYGSNSVSVFINNGSGTYAPKVDYSTGYVPISVSIGDLNGDGKPDLAVTNYNSNTVSVLFNNGNGTFAQKVDYTTGTSPYSVAISDLNGDGKPDLAIANYGAASVSILFNNGSGIFTAKVDYQTGENPRSVPIADLNGDGKPDLVIPNQSVSTVSVLFNNGSGIFAPKVDYTTGTTSYPNSVSVSDLDGDGKPDLAIANHGANTVSVLKNIMPPPPTITSFAPTSGPVGTIVTISGTGFNTAPANNVVFFGATKATVSAATSTSLTVTVPAGATYQNISVLDITSTLTAYSTAPFCTTFTGGVFASSVDYSTGTNPYSISIGDLNGDGKPDLAIANYGANTVSVFINNSTSGIVSFASKVDYTTGTTPRLVSIADLNGDGKPDLAVPNFNSASISVFINNGSGTFAPKVDYQTGTSPASISIDDLNGDGKPDLAVTNYGSNTVSVLFNNSSGTFATKVDYTTGLTPHSVAISDLDGDGKPDLAVANRGSATVSVFINNGSGTFATKVNYTTGIEPLTISTGDLNGDGKPDLAVANYGAASVSILLNTGSGTFANKVNYTTGANPGSVSIGDLNGDGKPDLAVANLGSVTVSVFMNLGNGTFATKVDYTTGTNPGSVAIGDLDGDGKPDLAVTNVGSNTVSVLRNIAPPTTTTIAATSITTSSAVLNGSSNPNGSPSTGYFRISSTNPGAGNDVFGTRVPASSGTDVGSGSAAVQYGITCTGLTPVTTYYYCAISTNQAGTSFGSVVSLTTPAAAPTVITNAAGSITSSWATLNASVNAGGASTAVSFEYGLTTSYGSTATAAQSPITGNSNTSVSAAIIGLTANTTYHYRVKGVNSAGTTYGSDLTFTTLLGTGIASESSSIPVIYPNPTTYSFLVTGLSDQVNLSIYNLTGQVLFSKAISNNESINVSKLNAGIYVVKVDGIELKLVIKQ